MRRRRPWWESNPLYHLSADRWMKEPGRGKVVKVNAKKLAVVLVFRIMQTMICWLS